MIRKTGRPDEIGAGAARRRAAGRLVRLACAAAALSAAAARAADYEVSSFGVGDKIYVRALALDERAGALWVGASTGALEIDLATTDLKNTFTRKDGLANEYVSGIGVAPSGEVWFGTNGGGASTYKNGAWRTYFPMHGLADYWVDAFDFDADANVWIATWEGVSKFEPAADSFTTYRDQLVNNRVYDIDIDDKGAIWFATEGGVSRMKDGAWSSWTHKDGLGAPDGDGPPAGADARREPGVAAGGDATYNPNYVFAVEVDDRGRGVWLGTWGGGVSLFDGAKGWRNYTVEDGLAGNLVYSIAETSDGVMWFGTDNGVSSFDGANWTTYRDGLPGLHFYSIVAQPNGVIWAGTKGAVVKFTPSGAGE
jgi:ligand-binding sensor domain-containing protein